MGNFDENFYNRCSLSQTKFIVSEKLNKGKSKVAKAILESLMKVYIQFIVLILKIF